MDLKEENAIGGDPASHWYYISKGKAIKSLLGDERADHILDVGAGSGVFSKMLVEDGIAGKATCVDPNYSDEWLRTTSVDNVTYVRGIEQTDASLVLMMDVIEHVDDDVALMADYARHVGEGDKFLITVPAFNFLWSSHDEFLDHRRRYSIESLEESVTEAGLKVIESRYFFGLLFPAVAALRLADKALRGNQEAKESALKAAPDWLNKTLIGVHDIERTLMFPFNKVAGVTAMCLAEKPRDSTAHKTAA